MTDSPTAVPINEPPNTNLDAHTLIVLLVVHACILNIN